MLILTHLVTAQVFYFGACIAAAHPPSPLEALAALAASLIPDLDCRQSYPGRLLPPISGWLEHQFGHRALTHSLLAQVVAGALAWVLLPFGYFLALVAGWVSHSVADMMTLSGVMWFWPARGRCVLPGAPRYRMESMSRGELGFLGVMALLGMLLMPMARTGEGTRGLIRSAIGDVAAARKEYDAGKGSHAFTLEVRGRDNRRHEDVSGTYPVIGPHQGSGFIIETPEGPRSLCRSEACDWYADHAALAKGDPEKTTTFEIEVRRTTADSLIESLTPLQLAGKVYLLGTLVAPGVRAAPPTVDVSGETVSLRYASLEALEGWKDRRLKEIDLVVQVRHDPGTKVVEPRKLATGPGRLHPLLRKWVERLK